MIVRKEAYKVDEAAFLLDLPSRCIIALCDCGILQCSRLVSNGPKKQRKRRHVAHDEIVRFNASREASARANLAARLMDATGPQQAALPFNPEPEIDACDPRVALNATELRLIVSAAWSFKAKVAGMTAILSKLGHGGANVINHGLRVIKES